jgi:hypothetical protein
MSLLDLQDLQVADSAKRSGGSKASKGCGNASALSLLLC